MNRLDAKTRLLAAGLSALAGYVDALGFIAMGGFFVSFMSGNSTRFAVGVAQVSDTGIIAGRLIAAFVLGVILGSTAGRLGRRRRRAAVMGLVCLLLATAASLNAAGLKSLTFVAMAVAMGAENAVFEEDGEVKLGVTYMTGALVKVGQGIAGALFGGDRFGWAPSLLLWIGLIAGAMIGAAVYARIALSGLWIAAVAAGLLAWAAAISDQRQVDGA